MRRTNRRTKSARRARRLPSARLGVIGGSGLYAMAELESAREVRVKTPFGEPSDAIVVGTIAGTRVAFLPRHGRGHRLLPSEINYRANIFALKLLGVEFLISVSAIGSLRREIRPGDVVIPDQFIDRTRGRRGSFFGDGIVAHVSFSEPVCSNLAKLAAGAARADVARTAGASVHAGGTYLCIEGPQFSTRAESLLYRQWSADVIGMTNLPEAKLAREAEICFSTLALATDYDCWNTEAGGVEIGEILRILHQNTERVQRIIRLVAARLPEGRDCACARALEHAIITDRSAIPARVVRALEPLVGRRL